MGASSKDLRKRCSKMLYGIILASKESKSYFLNRYLRDPIKHVSFVFTDNKNGTSEKCGVRDFPL